MATELAEALTRYTRINPELDRRFLDQLKRLVRAECAHPQRFRRVGLNRGQHRRAWAAAGAGQMWMARPSTASAASFNTSPRVG